MVADTNEHTKKTDWKRSNETRNNQDKIGIIALWNSPLNMK